MGGIIPWENVVLSLGSNQGDRLSYLHQGIDLLRKSPKLRDVRSSSVYETAPWGLEDQPAFLNVAVSCRTSLRPLELLRLCQRIETQCGRSRSKEVRWGPRTLDVDLVKYGDQVIESDELQVPHPRAYERGFVLIPMQEITPEAELGGQPIRALIKNLGEEQDVRLYAPPL